MGIADYFANLGNPQERAKIFHGAVKAVVSPAKGSIAGTKASRLFLDFANKRQQSADTLARKAGFEPPQAEVPSYVASLHETESGGDFGARNSEVGAGGAIGHFGRSQFGVARFEEAKAAGAVPANMTITEFGSDTPQGRAAQVSAENWHYNDLEQRLGDLVGTEVNGVPMTMGALVAMGHLGGAGGARRYVETGGAYNPSDSFGTSLSDYAARHGGDPLAVNSRATPSGNVLSFGREEEALAEEYIGRSADNYSMGMKADDFETLREKYGVNEAMRILNTTQGDVPQYDDAIMRFLQEGAEEAAQEQPTLPNGGVDLGPSAVGLSMGTPVNPTVSAKAATGGGGGGGTATNSRATATASDEKDQPKLTAVDRMMNAIYGTDVDDMTDDERADRRRAVGQAMGQGFQMLSRGTPMDIQPIIAQRMALQQVRRASDDLKKNAQGVADMLVAAGMDELAQLPFMGENGMNAAMQVLSATASAKPEDRPFDVSPEMRATMAQTLADMGYEGPAQLVMNTEAGPAFQEVWNNAVGTTTRASASTTEDGGAIRYSPEQIENFAKIMEGRGNPDAAAIIRSGASPKVVDDLLKGTGNIETAGATAGATAAATTGVETAVAQASADNLATGLETAGAPSDVVEAVRQSGSYEAGKLIFEQTQQEATAAAEQALIRERGAAMAELVPDDHPQAEALKAAALNAETSQDLAIVFEQMKGQVPTDSIRTLQALAQDPELLRVELMRSAAAAGKDPALPPSVRFMQDYIGQKMLKYSEGAAMRERTVSDMRMLQALASDPNLDTGFIQGKALIPVQSVFDSVFGVGAVDLVSEGTVTTARMVQLVRDNNFAAASTLLSGAISNMESETFKNTFPSINDSRTQILALAQYHVRNAAIADAEYAATLEWLDQTSGTSTAGDKTALDAYVKKRVEEQGLSVFADITGTPEQAASKIAQGYSSGKYQIGEVVRVIDPETRAVQYHVVGVFPND
jgi:hypothetical protein